jgi:hypothetical protein
LENILHIIVENKVIIELKAAEGIVEAHEAQLLKLFGKQQKLRSDYLNFGKNTTNQRQIFENKYKDRFKSV